MELSVPSVFLIYLASSLTYPVFSRPSQVLGPSSFNLCSALLPYLGCQSPSSQRSSPLNLLSDMGTYAEGQGDKTELTLSWWLAVVLS